MSVVPHNRRGRIILDFYFPCHPMRDKKGGDPIQESVNKTVKRLAPDMSVT